MNKGLNFAMLLLLVSFLYPSISWSKDNNSFIKDDNIKISGDKCIPAAERRKIEARIKANYPKIEAKKKADHDCKPVSKVCLYKTDFNSYCGSIEIPLIKTDYCINSYQDSCYKMKDEEVKLFDTQGECESYNNLVYKNEK